MRSSAHDGASSNTGSCFVVTSAALLQDTKIRIAAATRVLNNDAPLRRRYESAFCKSTSRCQQRLALNGALRFTSCQRSSLNESEFVPSIRRMTPARVARSYQAGPVSPRCTLEMDAKQASSQQSSEDAEKSQFAGKRYHIETFGCQMNKADSERMAGQLESLGLEWSADPNTANVLVYNTCSIRESSEHKAYSYLGRQAERKREHPEDVTIVFAGCVAQQEGEALLRRVPEIDLVMGPQHANRIADLLPQVSHGQVVATDAAEQLEDMTQPRRDSKVSAWVNVIYGCNERCTYCVVPNTRGVEQSRHPDAILKEVQHLGRAGFKEITLLGQNIDAYGRDLPGITREGRRQHTLTDLLYHIHDVPGIERIRFVTSHPRYFSPRLIKACADLPKVCEWFHIPFQSGDDDVLKAMRRGYTIDRYRSIIHKIWEEIPNAAISADVIVGFPGETEAQFQRTLDLVNELQFGALNTAAYSPRPGTPAAIWELQVDEETKKERLHRLNRAVTTASFNRNQQYLNRIEEVLVEMQHPKLPHLVMGRTRTNRITYFPGDLDALLGKLVPVHITDARSFTLYGTVADLSAPPLAS